MEPWGLPENENTQTFCIHSDWLMSAYRNIKNDGFVYKIKLYRFVSFVFKLCIYALLFGTYKLEMVLVVNHETASTMATTNCNCIKSQMWCKLHCLCVSPGKYIWTAFYCFSEAERKCGVIKSERTILLLYDLWEFAWWIYHWLLLGYGFRSECGGNNFSSFCMKSRLDWMHFLCRKRSHQLQ